ncbi:MAG: hypothetical protein EOS18_31405 [Mesorhizobium sp.]|nr:MAG: hypothetical protein EOS18_31405 [Mesorhizobium sp.]
MTPVQLNWKRPADGMEEVKAARFTDWLGKTDNRVFAPKSNTPLLDVQYKIENLEDPVVLRFINARRENKLLEFVSRFGQLDNKTMYVIKVEFAADELENRLHYSTSTPPRERTRWVNAMLEHVPLKASFDDSARIVLHPTSLYGLMALEVALAHEAGAVVASCAHCGTVYLTGPLTWRRSHSVYCSVRCRVAASRKRKAGKVEG